MERAKGIPNARLALYLQAGAGDIWLDIEMTGQHCVWWHLYKSYLGAESLGAGQLSDWERVLSFQNTMQNGVPAPS
jgi:hypothetical protein